MLLAVDIGNSRVKLGLFDGEQLVSKLSIPTIRDITAEGLTKAVADKLFQGIKAAIVSSVVPEINSAILSFISTQFGVEAMLVTNDLDFDMQIDYFPLEDAGTDRLVNTFSAVEKYGAPCIVCSFGTALTIDAVDKDRVLKGGLIAPGMNTLATALKLTTSRLPQVDIEKPPKVVQNTTIGSIQSGIVYGYFGLVEGLLTAVKNEIGDNPKVIATGGFAAMVAANTNQIDVVDNDLMLDGLARLYRRVTASENR
ncbi:MAG: type III pantothenate kinase [Pyrinomonadaceae bacterium]